MPEPRPSATVVLLRDASHEPELLLVRRRAGDIFGEAYAFPGGVVDPDDVRARAFCAGLSPAEANAALRLEDGALDYFSAVVRELYEETGVFLGTPGFDDAQMRQALIAGTLAWPDLLRDRGLSIACNTLHYFAHWVTPVVLPKRWSTRYFLAVMPAGIEATPDEVEITECRWLTAAEAIEAAGRGDLEIPFPTHRTLQWLRELPSVAELVKWADRRQSEGVPRIRPEVVGDGRERRIVIPDELD